MRSGRRCCCAASLCRRRLCCRPDSRNPPKTPPLDVDTAPATRPHRGRHAAALLAESAAVPRSQRLSFGAILLLDRGTALKEPPPPIVCRPAVRCWRHQHSSGVPRVRADGRDESGEMPESRLAGRRLRWPSSRGATEEAQARGGGRSLPLSLSLNNLAAATAATAATALRDLARPLVGCSRSLSALPHSRPLALSRYIVAASAPSPVTRRALAPT